MAAFALDPGAVSEAGGATGMTWRVHGADADLCLRVVPSASATHELAAMSSAAVAVPVPALVERAPIASGTALLLSWLPGRSMLDVVLADPGGAHDAGAMLGACQRRLHGVLAPRSLASGSRWRQRPAETREVPSGSALLHLDLHPRNVLMDRGAISGVVDWANARRGAPSLDLARTYTLLTLDPGARRQPLPEAARTALVTGWLAGYGASLDEIPPAVQAWAGRAMLRDLAHRYAHEPAALAPARAWMARQERASAATRRTGTAF